MSGKPLHLDLIRLDGDTQPRAEINETTVAEYAEAMEGDAEFPPVVVFHDGAEYWLADGFHRYHAMKRAGLTSCRPEVKSGTRRDAILYSVGANQAHGLRRSNADKRKAVFTLLNDFEWVSLSDSEIAKACGVDQSWVSRLRRDEVLSQDEPKIERPAIREVTRGGTTYQQDTTNIGRRAETAPEPLRLPERIPPAEISDAMAFAESAISQLERISRTDPHRVAALFRVNDWIANELNREEQTA